MEMEQTVRAQKVVRQPNELRWLADVYMQAQKLRIAVNNRRLAISLGRDDPPEARWLMDTSKLLQEVERQAYKRMMTVVRRHPAWPWLSRVKGIGPTLDTKLLGLIDDISTFTTVSKLWRYAGLGVVDGKAERLVKGEKAHFNRRLKTVMYLIGTSFIKLDSPYRQVYDAAKARYQVSHPDWSDGHRHLAAMRVMEKLFLSHLWEVWRTALGLPVRPPYAMEYLRHSSYRGPAEFVESQDGAA